MKKQEAIDIANKFSQTFNIYIGDVMLYIFENTGATKEIERIHELILLWRNFGYDIHLQRIIDNNERENDLSGEAILTGDAENLFEFLKEIQQ